MTTTDDVLAETDVSTPVDDTAIPDAETTVGDTAPSDTRPELEATSDLAVEIQRGRGSA